jgi:hypothetical protein
MESPALTSPVGRDLRLLTQRDGKQRIISESGFSAKGCVTYSGKERVQLESGN